MYLPSIHPVSAAAAILAADGHVVSLGEFAVQYGGRGKLVLGGVATYELEGGRRRRLRNYAAVDLTVQSGVGVDDSHVTDERTYRSVLRDLPHALVVIRQHRNTSARLNNGQSSRIYSKP